jgi:FtsP/CotA-like multicopper oxidase with cupredoxin domain
MEPYDYLKIGLINWPNLNDNSSTIRKWTLMNRTMQLDWSKPSLQQYISGKPNFTEDQQPITLDYNTGEWIYFVITNNYTLSTHPPRMDPPSVHPIHLHGHDFVILAQGEGPFHRDIEPNLTNPTRRDVADCPIGGFVWIAFQVNNPGAWLMHCHIAWHASAGLSLQYLEQPSKIKPLMQQAGIIPEFQQRCDAWTKWYNTKNKADDELIEDSGI